MRVFTEIQAVHDVLFINSYKVEINAQKEARFISVQFWKQATRGLGGLQASLCDLLGPLFPHLYMG